MKSIRDAILDLDTMGSMRCLMTAGVALDRDNVAGYNCSYLAIDGNKEYHDVNIAGLDEKVTVGICKPIDFDEAMYVLLCGTGVGFSVERQFILQLPTVGKKLSRGMYARTDDNYPGVDQEELSTFSHKTNTIYVADSKYGWASSYRILITELYNGNFDLNWDVSKVREKGARLKTFGGRASGPEPLIDLFKFSVGVFKEANGRKLTSLECHDLTCKIADIVVVGGVRRSALISLSNLTDQRMRDAKHDLYVSDPTTGEVRCIEPQRQLANNSICYTEKPDIGTFLREWRTLYESNNGERGVYNRRAAQLVAERNGRRDATYDFGTNPCSEIILRSKQFCNLSEVVVRSDDTYETLKQKVRIATIIGTLQSTLTDFKYLSTQWKDNTEEERLLGVSLTGIMDHPVLSGGHEVTWFDKEGCDADLPTVLQELKEVAVETNKEWAEKLGINPSTAITCVKPSGTVSQLVDSASGIHPRHNAHYIRTVRTDKKDPIYDFLKDMGVPVEDAMGKEESTAVFSWPIEAPEGSILRDDRSAIEQLELWKVYAEHWCEHKPSITVYVKEDEWLKVGSWVYDNFDIVSGVSFLPHDGGVYPQAPYQDMTEDEYLEAVALMPKDIDWSKMSDYENEDTMTIEHELACSAGGSCEIL